MVRVRTCIRPAALIITIAAVAAVTHRPTEAHAGAEPAVPPNVVVIVTDDQRFDAMGAMPITRALLGDLGITFDQAVVSNPLCCPSRAALLLGAYSHTTHVYTNTYRTQPYGAWPAFLASGDEDRTIAVALHEHGYRTALFGKYFNDFTGIQAPPGWDRFAAFLDEPAGGAYYDYSLLVTDERGVRVEPHGHTHADYSTQVIEDMAVRFVRGSGDAPFLLYLTPFGPHGPATPAPGDAGSWDGPEAVANPGLNERDVSDKPGYIRELRPPSSDTYSEHVREASETLASVDRMVGRVVRTLEDEGVMDRTMIVFTSDNGLSLGEHRWRYKLAPYEESIRVPLIVRYDPITAPYAGTTSGALIANIDVVPTVAEVAGVPYRGVGSVDGRSLVPLLGGTATAIRRDVLLEHLDYPSRHPVPSYCGLRTERWMFVRYATGERELYDLVRDPYQLRNLASTRMDVIPQLLRRTKELCVPAPPGYTWG